MKKFLSVLLCAVLLLTSLSMLCSAEYVNGRDEPSVETAVENTIGKYLPTGPDVADAYFGALNSIKEVLENVRDFFEDLLAQVKDSFAALDWVPGWMR